jgi:hypothetical protein
MRNRTKIYLIVVAFIVMLAIGSGAIPIPWM